MDGKVDMHTAHNEPPAFCYSSVWLLMNVLVLDPKIEGVEKRGLSSRTNRYLEWRLWT